MRDLFKKILHLVEIGVLTTLLFLIVIYLVKSSGINLELIEEFMISSQESFILYSIALFFLFCLGLPSSFLIFVTSLIFSFEIALLICISTLFLSCAICYNLSNIVEHRYIEKYHLFYKYNFNFVKQIFEKVKFNMTEKTFISLFIIQIFITFVPSCYIFGLFKEKIESSKFYFYVFINSVIYVLMFSVSGKIFLALDYKSFLFLIFIGIVITLLIKKSHMISILKNHFNKVM